MAADVTVRFLADTAKLKSEIAEVEGTGSKIKNWAKGVGLAIAGAFAVDQIKNFINVASELQDAMAANAVIFGDSAKAVQKFADTTSEAFGIAKVDALKAAATFGTFGKAAGLQGKELSGFSTNLVGLAGDLASFKGTSTEQAITAIGAALRGEAEPIRAYGVLLDDATLKAEAMSLGLLKASTNSEEIAAAQNAANKAQVSYNDAVKKYGEGSQQAIDAQVKLGTATARLEKETAGTIPTLTAQQKVLAAQSQIYKQTGDAQGDFGRTADSAANQQKILAATMKDTQAALGTALLPVLQTVLPIIKDMAKWIGENASILVPLAAGIGAVVAAQWAWNAAMAANPITLIVVGIAAIIAGIVLLIKNWDTVKEVALEVWARIYGVIQTVWEWIKDHWPLLATILFGPFGLAAALIINNWDDILAFFSSIPGTIAGFFSDIWRIVTGPFVDAFNFVKNIWNTFARGWNHIQLKLPEVDLGPLGHIGGQTIGLPDLPMLAKGGIVRGPTLALLGEAGPEAVIPLSRTAGPGGTVINVSVNVPATSSPADVGRAVVDYIRSYERVAGVSWRAS